MLFFQTGRLHRAGYAERDQQPQGLEQAEAEHHRSPDEDKPLPEHPVDPVERARLRLHGK